MTGGLLDSVPAYNQKKTPVWALPSAAWTAGDMLGALYRAVGVYYDDKKAWDQLVTGTWRPISAGIVPLRNMWMYTAPSPGLNNHLYKLIHWGSVLHRPPVSSVHRFYERA